LKGKTPRAISLELLDRIEKTDRHLDLLLSEAFKRYRHLTPRDRAFLTELAYGVLRWKGRLDWVIHRYADLSFEKIEPRVLHILRLGLYQILFLTRTPVSAAVNESVELAKKIRGKGGASFVNAILRRVVREKDSIAYPSIEADPAAYGAVVESYPEWAVRRWIAQWGVEKTLLFCREMNRIASLTLRTNTLRISRDTLIQRLREKGLSPVATTFSEEGILLEDAPPVSELPFLGEGLYVIQDEASQLVCQVLDPKPGEIILDACAAPGGKTTHMAQRMRNEGGIYALDVTKEKLKRVREATERLGITIVKTLWGDAAKPLPVKADLVFDRVLADVPCSGYGTLRKNPDLKWRRQKEDIERLARLQLSILQNISRYVKAEGILVYSTCTVFREENEDVVETFLRQKPEFQLEPVSLVQGRLKDLSSGNYLKTFPESRGMDGFFVARLKKRS
jgi:16S rRNA (cytosine967-C5)-methyltransferase